MGELTIRGTRAQSDADRDELIQQVNRAKYNRCSLFAILFSTVKYFCTPILLEVQAMLSF